MQLIHVSDVIVSSNNSVIRTAEMKSMK